MAGIGKIEAKEPPLDGGQRHRASDKTLLGGVGGNADHFGQAGDRLVIEHLAGLQGVAEGLDPGDDLDGADGIAAQFKEVVMDADPSTPQRGLPDVPQQLFDRGAWFHRTLIPCGGGLWQGPPVELAIHRQWQRFEAEKGCGHQGFGKPLPERIPEPARVGGRTGLGRHDIGHQAPGASFAVDADRRVPHAVASSELGFDLAQLDPVAGDLHLLIDPA